MVLSNLAVRYPIGSTAPNGSDSYFTLELGRSLAINSHADWILTPLSYFGLFPLSYPSGAPFIYAEYEILSGTDWNTVPWVASSFFAILTILAGFLLLRSFRIGDATSALLSGLMALSPYFIYFTYGQASARGFVVPIFMLGLVTIFLSRQSALKRLLLFLLFAFVAFSMHRSSMVIFLCEVVAGIIVFVLPMLPRIKPRWRTIVYASYLLGGLALVLWPYVPGLRDFFGGIPEIYSSYRLAEWDFRTGFFFEGESPLILFANMATNYVGSIGLAMLALPIGILVLLPASRESRERDVFLLAVLLIFAPFVWKAQYIQLMVIPFSYLLLGLAIMRRNLLARRVRDMGRIFGSLVTFGSRPARRLGTPALATFLVLSLIFSLVMFVHRASLVDPRSLEGNYPDDDLVNFGLYLSAVYDDGSRAYVSDSGLLDRRIGWFSGWNSPVTDPAILRAKGYLVANSSDFYFEPVSDRGIVEFWTSLYRADESYLLNSSVVNYSLYSLSWGDVFGFLRLYIVDPSEAYLAPKVSTSEAGISQIVILHTLGSAIKSPYVPSEVFESNLLKVAMTSTYCMYRSETYSSYLAAVGQAL